MLNAELFIGNTERVIDPLFESKDSFWVDGELCKRFGVNPRAAEPFGKSIKQNVFDNIMNTCVLKSDGTTWERLIKFNTVDEAQAVIEELNVEADANTLYESGAGRMTYQEFKDQGFYQVHVNETMRSAVGADGSMDRIITLLGSSAHLNAGFEAVDHSSDPGILSTETGKLEIYSMNLAKYYDVFGFETHLDPIAKWQTDPHGYGGIHYNNGYNMQYINVHPHHRVHSSRGDNKNVLEVFDDVLFMNPVDATRYNLQTGDTAKLTCPAVTNALELAGNRPEVSILRRVSVTNSVIPGAIIGIEGTTARFDLDQDELIDYGGCANSLAAPLLCGQAHQAYNSIVVKVEKWAGTPLKPNYQWASDTPKFSEV
jgi:anaerobic dimethyl sulfoxide reductase subunit A